MIRPENKAAFDTALLTVLDEQGSSRFGLGVEALKLLVGRFGFSPSSEDVEKSLRYLEGEPLAHIELVDRKGFNPQARSWRITTRGMNWLLEQSPR
jgi:hypothetical protein